MHHEQAILHISPESELSRRLKEAALEGKPLRLMSGGTVYDVAVREQARPQDIWRGYDPAHVRQALTRSAGALTGVDRDALRRDIQDARTQRSQGRPD